MQRYIKTKLETFSFYDHELRFNVKSFEEKVRELISKQNNLIVLLNTPNHNPTGYRLSDSEWDQVIDVIKKNAKGDKSIVLLVDTAYIDYLPDPDTGRKFIEKFSNLPANIFVTFAFSMSKGFTLYGQRTGAAIGVSSDKKIIDEFVNAANITCRTRWSSISRAGMQTMANIYKEPLLLEQLNSERKLYVDLLQRRADIFIKEAKEINLEILPYLGGFFISVPTSNPAAVSKVLQLSNIFVVPVSKGIRIGVCSVPSQKMRGLAKKVAEAIFCM